MKERRERVRWGTEFDWLAVDADGCVALLSSAGYGEVPDTVLRYADSVDEAMEAIEQFPLIGTATDIVTPQPGADYSDWRHAAAQGLYAYDWHVWPGPYERLASPTTPLLVSELPAPVRKTAELVRSRIAFSRATKLRAYQFVG